MCLCVCTRMPVVIKVTGEPGMTLEVKTRKSSRQEPNLIHWLDYMQNQSDKTTFWGRRYKLDSHTLPARYNLIFLKGTLETMSRVTPPIYINMNIGGSEIMHCK